MGKKIYSINFSRQTGDEFYFSATSGEVAKLERTTKFLADSEGWNDDEDGRKFVARINKHLFTFGEIMNKIKIYQNWGKN